MEENLKEFQAVGYLVILKTLPSSRVSRHIEYRLEEARFEFPRRYFILLANKRNKWVRSSASAYAYQVTRVLTCLCLCYAYACAYVMLMLVLMR